MNLSGPWSLPRMARHLADTVVPLRLACHAPSGWPLVLSLWYLHQDGALWRATAPTTQLVTCLERDPRCAFEVASETPPYRGVRGPGRAELLPRRGADVRPALIDRYLGDRQVPLARWLLARASQEVALRLVPIRLSSWDYTRRMASS